MDFNTKQIPQNCCHYFCEHCTLKGTVYGSDIEFDEECILCDQIVWDENHYDYEHSDYCPDYKEIN